MKSNSLNASCFCNYVWLKSNWQNSIYMCQSVLYKSLQSLLSSPKHWSIEQFFLWMFYILIFTITLFKFWILPVLWSVELEVAFTFHYGPWTGLIKPSLQHLKLCCVELSLGVPFFCNFQYKASIYRSDIIE